MKNIEHFGDLTPRMNDFREKVLDKKPYICAERALLATESYRLYQNQPPVMKRALMLKNILEKMSIYIEDETLIVGNQAASNKWKLMDLIGSSRLRYLADRIKFLHGVKVITGNLTMRLKVRS